VNLFSASLTDRPDLRHQSKRLEILFPDFILTIVIGVGDGICGRRFFIANKFSPIANHLATNISSLNKNPIAFPKLATWLPDQAKGQR